VSFAVFVVKALEHARPLGLRDVTLVQIKSLHHEDLEAHEGPFSPSYGRVARTAIPSLHRGSRFCKAESAYESCLAHELSSQGLQFVRQRPIPMNYKGTLVDCGYRADVIVEDTLLLELKSIDRLLPVHRAQVLTYLRLVNPHQGLIINFNVRRLVDGLRNVLR
jgi:GxxExxY protein